MTGQLPVSCTITARRGGAPSGAAGTIPTVRLLTRSGDIFCNHNVIFLTIRPSRKTVIPPPLWETTMPTHFVTLVIAATEL
jgi:hypothetical protein